jgi:thioredoxin-like negative regulator of GroEL
MQTLNRPVPVETSAELDALAAEHPLVLVEFYTNGCAICQSIEPVLGNVARASDVVVATCNPQTDLSLVERFGVQGVPTLVLLEDGEEVGRLADGFQGTESILEFVADARSDT